MVSGAASINAFKSTAAIPLLSAHPDVAFFAGCMPEKYPNADRLPAICEMADAKEMVAFLGYVRPRKRILAGRMTTWSF